MKLYDVPRETFVRVLADMHTPVGSNPIVAGEIIFFDHVDGMYSFCMNREKTQVLHLAAFSEVEIVSEEELEAFRQ